MGPGKGLRHGLGLLTNEGAGLVKDKGFHVLYFFVEANLHQMHFLVQHAPQLLVTQNAHHLTATLAELVAKARRHSGVHLAARYIPIELPLLAWHTLTATLPATLPATHTKAHTTVSLDHRSCFLTSKLHGRFRVPPYFA